MVLTRSRRKASAHRSLPMDRNTTKSNTPSTGSGSKRKRTKTTENEGVSPDSSKEKRTKTTDNERVSPDALAAGTQDISPINPTTLVPVTNTTDTSITTNSNITVRYEIVENIKNKRVRFAAYFKNGTSAKKWEKLSILQWALLLGSNHEQCLQFANELSEVIVEASSSYGAYFFETKGASSENSNEKQFEFVLVRSLSLQRAEREPDPNTFQEHFTCCKSKETACSFWNLGGSAKLIAPCAQGGNPLKTYSHFAPFLRDAPKTEVIGIWRLVADEYIKIMKEWSPNPVWLSTSGKGISWLHIRLDRRPKYYTFREFAKEQ